MTMLHVFMDIDTCPVCGREIYVTNNEHFGKRLEDIPKDTTWEIECKDATGINKTCGKFVISKRDKKTDVNDWVAEYIPMPRFGF